MTRSLTRDVDYSHQRLQERERGKKKRQSVTFKFQLRTKSETTKSADFKEDSNLALSNRELKSDKDHTKLHLHRPSFTTWTSALTATYSVRRWIPPSRLCRCRCRRRSLRHTSLRSRRDPSHTCCSWLKTQDSLFMEVLSFWQAVIALITS